MKSTVTKAVLILIASGAVIFGLVGGASAAHVLVDIAAPGEAAVGESVAIEAKLRSADDGQPATNTAVTFFTEGSFAGVTGEVELGRATTDENGLATLTYQPRSPGEHQIRVEYLTPGDTEPQVASTTASITVSGASQLHRSSAGVQIPGLNVWLIIAVVTGVWSILFGIGLRIVAIARAGSDVEPAAERAVRPTDASAEVAPAEASASQT